LHPKIVSNLRLAVNQPAEHRAADADPSPLPSPQMTYAAHYCAIPREVDPEIAACSFINSGLRIFNIQDPLHPREVAYFVSPPKTTGNVVPADFAMSQPAFDPATRQVWYTDASTGFYAVKLDAGVWPNPTSIPTRGSRCPNATGRLAGRALGPITLGRGRAELRRALPTFSVRNRHRMDFFCIVGGRIRVGYARGRAALVLTANPRYSLRGVHTKARIGAVARRLHAIKGPTIGRNTWWLVPGKRDTRVLKVQHGMIREIGIAPRSLASANRRSLGRFFRSFS
jgi:hypothetical protein